MKKFFISIAAILLLLFILDFAVLKDDGMVNRFSRGDKYEKARNVKDIPVGINNGERAPDFTLEDLDGNEITFSDFRGKKVLLNFWASWCGPCRVEMPFMERIYQQYEDEDITVVAVNMYTTEKNIENVQDFVDDFGLTFPIPVDKEGELHRMFQIMAYPTSYFIDSDGVIRSKTVGTMDEEHMLQELKKLQ